MMVDQVCFSYSSACTLMIWVDQLVDHNKVVLQNAKSTYFDVGNKIHSFESSSDIKENEMYIVQSKEPF